MLSIPNELQQAVRASQGCLIRPTAPETHAEYVLLPAEGSAIFQIPSQGERNDGI